MQVIYGYKTSEIKNFANYLSKTNKNGLTNIFLDYAKISNKSVGTIRNMYYAMAKKSTQDALFRENYLKGQVLKVNKSKNFTQCEEKCLLRQILLKIINNVSVRTAVLELANGNSTLALRYQNKYRSLLKNNVELVNAIKSEIELSTGKTFKDATNKVRAISEVSFEKLKDAINKMVQKLNANVDTENQLLKSKVFNLEKENEKLKTLLKSKAK